MDKLTELANMYMADMYQMDEEAFPSSASIESAVLNADKAFWESITESFGSVIDPSFGGDTLDKMLPELRVMQMNVVKEWLKANMKEGDR